MRSVAGLFVIAVSLHAQPQTTIRNPTFEEGEIGAVPLGWNVPRMLAEAGFTATLTDQNCRSGSRCAVISGIANPPPNMFGNLMQSVPAAAFARRKIRLRSAIRIDGTNTRAQMWMRLDRGDNSMIFLDNMQNRPVVSTEWATYDINADITSDTARIAFGVMVFGPGKAVVDDFTMEAVGDVKEDIVEPPRPLTSQALTNLIAFARLYGYVRFFHPSDQGYKTDWQSFAIDGVRQVESASNDRELAMKLRELFAQIAPTVQVYSGQSPPLHAALTPSSKDKLEMTRMKHTGVGLAESTVPAGGYQAYRSSRVTEQGATLPEPFRAEIVPGLWVAVPLTLYSDKDGTLPHLPMPTSDPPVRSAADRALHLGDVVIAWNIFQHFYPYFDVVKTDWNAELSKALQAAAKDTEGSFIDTLRRLVAALHDGHGGVYGGPQVPRLVPPFHWDWVEKQAIITRVRGEDAAGLKPGDRIVSIDGKPIAKAWDETIALISGATPQFVNYRGVQEAGSCGPGMKTMELEVEPYGEPSNLKKVQVPCKPRDFTLKDSYSEKRPPMTAELEPGIMYVDLDRITDAAWKEALPKVENAKGIIFDMRGYPNNVAMDVLARLAKTEIRSARWNIPTPSKPDRIDLTFVESGWPVAPKTPALSGRRAFLTDGRAISYAETVMGIVEHFKLGEIVGQPTAGTNGNVNPFRLPGGYSISWTGMRVLKHDNSQHHGIGILPTVPVSRTRKGVAEEKDEILLRAIQVVKGNQ